jgi:hypothetical protein
MHLQYERLIRSVRNVNPPVILERRTVTSQLTPFPSKATLKSVPILNKLARFSVISSRLLFSPEKGKENSTAQAQTFATVTFG